LEDHRKNKAELAVLGL